MLLNPFLKYIAGGLGIACLVILAWGMRVDHLRARWLHMYQAEHAGRIADRAAYTQAQKDAAALNKAHVEAETKLREQVNEANGNSFIANRDRLRAQSGAPKGSAGSAGVPQVPHPAPGTPPEVVSLPAAELLRAQELELQLNALIDWVNQQNSVATAE